MIQTETLPETPRGPACIGMSGPRLYTIRPMPPDHGQPDERSPDEPSADRRPADEPSVHERSVLDQARRRCTVLLDDLLKDANDLKRPSRAVADDVLAEGRAAYDQAAAAVEQLLRRLEQSLPEQSLPEQSLPEQSLPPQSPTPSPRPPQ
jgi:hypothetical protein